MTTRGPRSLRGFTLIELMVVVAIVGILATIGLRVSWRRDDARGFARKVQAAIFNARREALAIGVQRYRPMPPAGCSPVDAPPDTPRAACMPNTRLRISRDRVEQFNCALDECRPVNCFPCADSGCGATCPAACPPADDCTWSAVIRTYTSPYYMAGVGGYEITKVEYRNEPAGGWTDIAAFPASPVELTFRPDGSTDVSWSGTPLTPLGMPNESLRVFIKPAGVAVVDEGTICQGATGRCFLVYSATTKIAARWP